LRCWRILFLQNARGAGWDGTARLKREGSRAIEKYDWPGNVRELKNDAERSVVMYAAQECESEEFCPNEVVAWRGASR